MGATSISRSRAARGTSRPARPTQEHTPELPALLLWIPALLATVCALLYSSDSRGLRQEPATPAAVAPHEPPSAPATLTGAAEPRGPGARAGLAARGAPAPELAAAASDQAPRRPAAAPPVEEDPTGRLLVQVLDDALRAVPGASLELRLDTADGEERVERVRCDQRGRHVLELPAGELGLVAWSEGASAGPHRTWLAPHAEQTLELVLAPAHSVRGVVLDATSGLPIEGARVSFWTFAETDRVLTGPDGSFVHPRFPAGDAAHQLRVEAAGYGPSVRYLEFPAPGRWSLPPAHETGLGQSGTGEPALRLALVPELTIGGRLVDARGAAVAGASVSAEGYFRVLPGVASRDGAATTTDADGAFLLAGLRSDVGHALSFAKPGFATTALELPADGARAAWVGSVTLGFADALCGVVLDGAGQPVADIEVELRGVRESAAESFGALDVPARVETERLAVRTDPQGLFRFEGLRRDEYVLAVRRDLGTLVERALRTDDRAVVEGLVVSLPPESLTLEGVVRDARGSVAGALVELQRYGLVGRARTDAQGRFRIAGLDDEAEYELFASSPCPESGSPRTGRADVLGSELVSVVLSEPARAR